MEKLSVLHFKAGGEVNQTYIYKTNQLLLILKAFSFAKLKKILFENSSDKHKSHLCVTSTAWKTVQSCHERLCFFCLVKYNVMLMIK